MHNLIVTGGKSGQITGEQGNPNLVLEGALLQRSKGLQEPQGGGLKLEPG